MSEQVVITRDTRGETVNGKPRAPRVYVTGPHFGGDIFSSTEDRNEASTFYRHEAEALLGLGKWRNHSPKIEP